MQTTTTKCHDNQVQPTLEGSQKAHPEILECP